MQMLPKWVLPSAYPSVHDIESFTAVEMVAKVYGAMNALIADYNKFADTVNQTMENFTETEADARKEFEENITKVMRQFQCELENRYITEMKTLLNEALAAGTVTVTEVYDPDTEALSLVLGGEL